MYAILTVILAACQAVILFFPILFKTELRVNLMPLVALAVLWLHWFLFHGKSGAPALSVILWILFAFIGLQVLSPTVLAAFAIADRDRVAAPIVIGNADSPKAVAMVYHPGASKLPKTVNTLIAERLADNGCEVTLYTAHAELRIDPKKVSAIGLSSPVYLGVIRPPLSDFIKRTDLAGVKCFVITTGWFTPEQVEPVKELIESKGGIFIGGKKFTFSTAARAAEVAAFVDSIKDEF